MSEPAGALIGILAIIVFGLLIYPLFETAEKMDRGMRFYTGIVLVVFFLCFLVAVAALAAVVVYVIEK
jgi:fumarate reductase subunit D